MKGVIQVQTADRMGRLGSAIFTVLDDMRKEVIRQGQPVINLSIGSPDQPPAAHIIQALTKGVSDPLHYGYPLSRGIPAFLEGVAKWYQNRFHVLLDPAREVLSLMGSQDGLAHVCLCFVNPGDIVLVPDPGYPIYSAGPALAGGILHPMPLRAENEFLPDFSAIDPEIAKQAKIMVLNYPSNPVTAIATAAFFKEAILFAKKYNVIICHDIAYSELSFDGYRPISFLSVEGAKEVGVEFHSLSKTYNMAGCRLGFVVGNAEVIAALARLKSNIDYGVFLPVQLAGIAALTGPQDHVRITAQIYQNRRDLFISGVGEAGWYIQPPKATMFVWAPIPKGLTSMEFTTKLLYEAGVIVVPGDAFGIYGEGYVRIALVANDEDLATAIKRIQRFFTTNKLST
jgi:LL-diaminopimelate aminotransferase